MELQLIMKGSDWFWIIVFILLVGGLFASNHKQDQQVPVNVGTPQGNLSGPTQVVEGMIINIEVSHIEANAAYVLVYENTSTAFSSKTTTANVFINPTYPTATKGLLVIELYGYNSTTQTKQGPLIDQLTVTIVIAGGLPGNFLLHILPIFMIIIIIMLIVSVIAGLLSKGDDSNSDLICSQCKQVIESKDQFCDQCGYTLQEKND